MQPVQILALLYKMGMCLMRASYVKWAESAELSVWLGVRMQNQELLLLELSI